MQNYYIFNTRIFLSGITHKNISSILLKLQKKSHILVPFLDLKKEENPAISYAADIILQIIILFLRQRARSISLNKIFGPIRDFPRCAHTACTGYRLANRRKSQFCFLASQFGKKKKEKLQVLPESRTFGRNSTKNVYTKLYINIASSKVRRLNKKKEKSTRANYYYVNWFKNKNKRKPSSTAKIQVKQLLYLFLL